LKKYVTVFLFFIISATVIPISVFYTVKFPEFKKELKREPTSDEVKVYFHNENKVKTMKIEDYLCGVVAAEMPATFENEALKAQAVAARSYTFYKKSNPSSEHPEAVVCTDSTHCKAYKTKKEQLTQWGKDAVEYTNKIHDAVYSTAGEILTYNGEVAMTVFHSQSGGGRTVNSKDVWGGDVPYLVSVESHGEENAPNFYSTVTISFDEFKNKLIQEYPELKIESFADIGEYVISDGESVKTVQIGNLQLNGKDIRQIFGLRSSCFKIKCEENSIIFEVKGYGHGVGMSQYGANTLASEGYSYIDILKHYYTGTELNSV